MSKLEAAFTLIEAKTSPTEAAKQLGFGRSTIYREMRRLDINRPASSWWSLFVSP
jgi:transcriptional regulator of acetoin/glycerol metabolism